MSDQSDMSTSRLELFFEVEAFFAIFEAELDANLLTELFVDLWCAVLEALLLLLVWVRLERMGTGREELECRVRWEDRCFDVGVVTLEDESFSRMPRLAFIKYRPCDI